jgi:selenocysteine lyase/cysteine desulfurase
MPARAPDRYEASSPNIVAIAGLNASLRVLDQSAHLNYALEMTNYLLRKLNCIDRVQVLGVYEPGDTVGIASFVVDGYLSSDVGSILDDEYDISVRTGYHCAPYIHEYLNDKEYGGTVRVGIGLYTTKTDIDRLIEALETL